MYDVKGEVILLGDLVRESITEQLKIHDRSYIHKILRSSEQNWNSINEILQGTQSISLVLAQFTEYTLIYSCLPEYQKEFYNMCQLISQYPHIVFIYHDNLNNLYSSLDGEDSAQNDKEWSVFCRSLFKKNAAMYPQKDSLRSELDKTVSFLNCSDLRIAPYRTRLDISLSAQAFIDEKFQGLLLRLYVTNDRLWANEIDKLVNLFRDYLRRVGGYQVTLDQNRTQHGIIYAF